MEPTSLSDVAFETILKNIGRYKELITCKISPPVREMLGREMMERVQELGPEQVWTAMPYLEPHKTTQRFLPEDSEWILELEMKPGQSARRTQRVSINEVVQYLGQHAPNLREIFLEMGGFNESPQLEQSSIDQICQMKNLTRISIRFVTIKCSGFVRICRECQNLQGIDANRVLVDVDPKSMKMILDTLNSVFDCQEYLEMDFPSIFGMKYKKTDAPEPYRKAHAKIGFSPDTGFIECIPEITHLVIYRVDQRRDLKNHLHILSKVGDKVHIDDGNKPINSFGKLKELYWKNTYGYPTKLQSILSAPLLEKIEIYAREFDLGDQEAFFNRLRNRKIFTNVHEFLIRTWIYQDEPDPTHLSILLSEIEENSPVPFITQLKLDRLRRPNY
ncbi:Hypothetical predicted protein [Cloeon dipterum]|uniref:Uncharacterized protein n=1 Tax=Cloeon dipterum TaxID=197152 RepID=A0A8S1DV66_9INSE|nr:Hypothetical predicted protein [Cloeon dipterum]